MKPILFILSAPRSGSTLLRVYLGKFNGIVSLPETRFMDFYAQNKSNDHFANIASKTTLLQNWLSFKNQINEDPVGEEFFLDRLENIHSWQGFFSLIVSSYCHSKGIDENTVELIVEKSPPHIFRQKEIDELFPDNSSRIYLIRDPRDVVGSLKTCPWRTSDVYESSFLWKNSVEVIPSEKEIDDKGKSIIISYEEFVQTNGQSLSDKWRSLGLHVRLIEKSIPINHKGEIGYKNVDSFKPLSNSHLNKWKERLSRVDMDLEVIEWICGEQMKKYGYKKETKNKLHRSVKMMLKFKYFFHRASISMFYRFGPGTNV